MTDFAPLLSYIDKYWAKTIRDPYVMRVESGREELKRRGLIPLRHPYLVPSHAKMFQEMYYWDSYFISLGLIDTQYEQYVIDMTENMHDLFVQFGVIPNASRYFFLSRSQPPFFTRMMRLSYAIKCKRGDADAPEFLRRMLGVAVDEHDYVWMGTEQPHRRKIYRNLSRYFDANFLHDMAGCESGWDHSTRCDGRWLDHLPVDLNSILYVCEQDIAWTYRELEQPDEAAAWENQAQQRKMAMLDLMWDREKGFFFDYDLRNKQLNRQHPSLAGFYPLWAGLAEMNQAQQILEGWLDDFEFDGGLVTTLQEQEGKQWAYPNGWAPLQWIATEGLDNYAQRDAEGCFVAGDPFHVAAQRIRKKWCENCAEVFDATDAIWEKYNVVEIGVFRGVSPGFYGQVEGFGWSNAVFKLFAQALIGG